MALSVLSLLVPSVKADPAAAALGTPTAGQNGQSNESNPFAQMLGACQQGSNQPSGVAEAGDAKALATTLEIAQALQEIQTQLEALPEGANLAEALENIAAFQTLPVSVQDRILQEVKEGAIKGAAALASVLQQVQQSVIKTLPAAAQAKWRAHIEALQAIKADKKEIVLAKEETDADKEDVSKEGQELAAALMQLLNPLAQAAVAAAWDGHTAVDVNAGLSANILVVSATPAKSAGAENTLLDNIDTNATPQDIATLTANTQGSAGQGNDNADTTTSGLLKASLEGVKMDAAQLAANAGVSAGIEDSQQQAQLEAIALSNALHADKKTDEKMQLENQLAQEAHESNVLVPMQPVRLSRASAGGQSHGNDAPKISTALSGQTLMLGGGMVAQLGAGLAKDAASLPSKGALDHSHAAGQVLGKLTVKPHRDSNEYSIQLDPIELGKLEIKMDINSNGEVKLSIMAESRHALEALQRDARMLEKGLQDAGLKLDSSNLHFSMKEQSQQSAGAFADGEGRENGNRQTGENRGNSPYRDGSHDTSLDIIMPYRSVNADGLDIHV